MEVFDVIMWALVVAFVLYGIYRVLAFVCWIYRLFIPRERDSDDFESNNGGKLTQEFIDSHRGWE